MSDQGLTETQKAEQRKQLGDFYSCDPDELRGIDFNHALSQAEKDGAVVYWGSWTDSELDTIL